MTNSVIIKY